MRRMNLTAVTLVVLEVLHLLVQLSASATLDTSELIQQANEHRQWLVDIRRHLHQWPETLYQAR